MELTNKIYGAVVCQFSSPLVESNDFKKNISTANILMKNGVWQDKMEIVQSTSYIQTNGLHNFGWEVLLTFELASQVAMSSITIIISPSIVAPMNWMRLGW